MKKALLLLAIVSIVSITLSGCIQEGTGILVLQITDAPGDLNITKALVTISLVEVHFAGVNDTNISGEWRTVVEDSQTFDLIAIQDVKEFFGSAELDAGWYTQIRLHVDKAAVTIDGVEYNLTIPSRKVKLIKPFSIEDGQTITLTLDFDVQESVHRTGSDKYIFNPTIKVIQE